MDQKLFESDEQTRTVIYPLCWCGLGPVGPTGTIFFGAILSVIGGVWFLFNLGVITPSMLDLLWPLGLTGVGLSYLGWALYARSRSA